MGRKAIDRERKKNHHKTEKWIEQLFPYFQDNGLKNITMDLVAQKLNKSKTTIYEYFQSKEELLELIVNYKINQIRGFEAIINNQETSFKNRCYELLKFQAEYISDISNLFLSDLKELFPELWKKIEDFLDEVAQKIEYFYQEGIHHQEFNPIHTAIVALNDRLFFRAITNPDFLSRHGLNLKEAFDNYAKLKFFGLINTSPKNNSSEN